MRGECAKKSGGKMLSVSSVKPDRMNKKTIGGIRISEV